MIKEKMQKAINDQIQAEFYSAYLYLAMSAALEDMKLPGFAHWTRFQAKEETEHAMKFYQYLVERGGSVKLGAVKAPPAEWTDLAVLFKEVLKHEQYITGRINDLVDLAIADKDHATNAMLQWFVNEQVEEEAHAEEVLRQIEMTQGSKGALYMLDKQMGSRS